MLHFYYNNCLLTKRETIETTRTRCVAINTRIAQI